MHYTTVFGFGYPIRNCIVTENELLLINYVAITPSNIMPITYHV